MKVFEGPTRMEAWIAATEYLLETGSSLNVSLYIAAPSSDGPMSAKMKAAVDRFLASEEEYPLHTVAETIFPAWDYRKRGLRGVYEKYGEAYDILRRNDSHRWGTYAERLVRRRTADANVVNPLNGLIEKMRNELQQQNRGAYKSCYELGIAEGAYDLPLYNTVEDQGRRRGGPCLSHLSFKLFNDKVHLAATYRSHDYRYKTLGNLLGLARLQACVAEQVGIPMGDLVVHSTYAFVQGSKSALRALIEELRALANSQQQARLQ